MADEEEGRGGSVGGRGGARQPSAVQRVSSDPSIARQPFSRAGPAFVSHGGAARANPLYHPSPSLDSGPPGASSSSSSIFRFDSVHDVGPLSSMTPQQWSRYMKSEISSAQRPLFRRSKIIFPVPKALHEVRPQAYYPRLLSIGPIHARRLTVSPMDRCKALCVKEFLQCCSESAQLPDLISTLFHPDDNPAGANYYGIPKYDKDTLELLISVDAVFVLEFMRFLLMEDTEQRDSDGEQVVARSYMWDHIHNHLTVSQILRDLFLVGNQLPDLISALFHPDDNPTGVNYYRIPKYNKDTLELLISVDAVFVLEFMCFLLLEDTEERESNGEQATTRSYMWDRIHNHLTVSQILRDLFLVGNQVPLSNVVRLAEYQDRRDELLVALEYMIWRCSPFINISPESKSHFADFRELLGGESLLECEHLLDCLYLACVKKTTKKPKKKGSNNSRESSMSVSIKSRGVGESSLPKKLDRIPRVSELRKVGVKFKGVIGNTSAVGYDKNKLVVQLPKLVVYDETECTLRNLVAYELTSREEGEICAYVMLMDSLVDTSDDLAILYKAGVLENHLGSDEKLLCMWNDMCVNITEANSKRLDEMTHAIMIHYKTNWRVIYVEFHHLFLSRPWLLLSTVAAVLLLFMTALQTVYSVVGFYKG